MENQNLPKRLSLKNSNGNYLDVVDLECALEIIVGDGVQSAPYLLDKNETKMLIDFLNERTFKNVKQ